jgi:hypothetical protein
MYAPLYILTYLLTFRENISEEEDDCPAIVPFVTPAPIQSIWAKKPNLNLHAESPMPAPIVHSPPTKPTASSTAKPSASSTAQLSSSTSASTTSAQEQLAQKQEDLVSQGVVASSQSGQTEKLVLDTVTFIKHVKLESVDVQYYTGTRFCFLFCNSHSFLVPDCSFSFFLFLSFFFSSM